MNEAQRTQATAEAKARIAAGEDPEGLVHVVFFPRDAWCAESAIQGLSTPLAAGSDLSGYTSRYYTLEDLAAA